MSNLNLARKLRPKAFNEIIGQDLSISMLQNSLFVQKLFPVYLFSGQRGCGKTSTARVFAAAVNCKKLPEFQADAKSCSIPCLSCESCTSMQDSNHPDFIEMDAASHTGVDSVRQIIESCTYMPLSGDKKIYLIDEAHMLSRAAFNAFLKILEEPPASTIFILATTEIQKIPDTVRSRCFQIVFNPVQSTIMHNHLRSICASEAIAADDDALTLLIQENDGSVRDAINTLEQVRFTGEKITKELVLKSLGKISETQLYAMLNIIFDQNPHELLKQLQAIKFETRSAQTLWSMITQALRELIWIKYKVMPARGDENRLKALADKCSINKLHALTQIMWSQESLFLQTPQKHLFLETVLLSMCRQVPVADLKKLLEKRPSMPKAPMTQTPVQQTPASSTPPSSQTAAPAPWISFLIELEKNSSDPLLLSIFKQAHFIGAQEHEIKIQLASNSPFLKDKINETENLWKSVVTKHFPQCTSLAMLEGVAPPQVVTPRVAQPPVARPHPYKKSYQAPASVDISDAEKWPKATLLTKTFSGRLERVKSDQTDGEKS